MDERRLAELEFKQAARGQRRTHRMTAKPSDFEATVAYFKAVADEKLARLRASPQYDSFISDAAVEAFAKVEGSAYAGRPKRDKARAPE